MSSSPTTRKMTLSWPIRRSDDLPLLGDLSSVHVLEIWIGQKVILNSNGIRHWIRWLEPHTSRSDLKIHLYECPESFINLAFMISDFLPPNAEVMSLYVPFYSDQTQESQSVLLTREKIYIENGKLFIPELKDQQGNVMELDMDVRQILKFLKLKP